MKMLFYIYDIFLNEFLYKTKCVVDPRSRRVPRNDRPGVTLVFKRKINVFSSEPLIKFINNVNFSTFSDCDGTHGIRYN